MVRAILSMALRETRNLHETAYLLAGLAFLSQLLALLRDRLLAGTFGTGETLDLYYAAFRIPDLLFAMVASLLSLYALLPTLSRLEHENPGLMVSFLRRSLLLFFTTMGVISAALFVLAPILVPLAAPGIYSPELVVLTQIMLLQPVLLGASNIIASLTQLRHRFLLYSISPLLYNMGIIAGILFLYPMFGVAGLAWGVVLGALLHLLVQVPLFSSEDAHPTLSWKRLWVEMKSVLLLSVPRTLALSASQVSLLVLVAMASLFAPGSISVFMFAFNLFSVPLTIIGVSYSVAAFPTLSRLFAGGDHATFSKQLEAALRHIMFWAIPAIVFLIVLRAQVVRVVLGAGVFDWEATRLTAAALALFSLALLAQSASLLIARAYYASGESRKPFYFGLLDVVVSIGSALMLVAAFHVSPTWRFFLESLLRVADLPGTTVLMLALGFALGSIVKFSTSMLFLGRDFSVSFAQLGRLFWQSSAAAIIGGAAAYVILWMTGGLVDTHTVLGLAVQAGVAGIAGLCSTAGVLYLLGNRELSEVYGAARRKFLDAAPVALEPTDVSS